MAKTKISKMRGAEAIRYAQRNPEAVMICKYEDLEEHMLLDLTPGDAWKIAEKDPSLIFIVYRHISPRVKLKLRS